MKNETILLWADRHAPYEHQDAYEFIFSVADKYRITRAYDLGDSEDHHGINFHAVDPDLPSHGDELQEVIRKNQRWYRAFPNLDRISSNHGNLVLRKALKSGISKTCLKSLEEMIEAPQGWKTHDQLIIESGGFRIVLQHEYKSNVLTAAREVGLCLVQAHYHTQADIRYFTTADGQLKWAMSLPCLIDDKQLSFVYNKTNTRRPILGCALIENGIPRILPMILDKRGRWIGVTP